MKHISESELEKKLRKFALANGGLIYKWVSPGTSAVMDRIIIWPDGEVHFLETKKAKEKLRPLQKLRCAEMRKNKAQVFSVAGLDQLENYKQQVLEKYGRG